MAQFLSLELLIQSLIFNYDWGVKIAPLNQLSPWRLSVAPMMDWTDRHCRFFHRLLSQHTLLYTAMVTTGALRHGSVERHLRFNAEEHPVALQLGGSEPEALAHSGIQVVPQALSQLRLAPIRSVMRLKNQQAHLRI